MAKKKVKDSSLEEELDNLVTSPTEESAPEELEPADHAYVSKDHKISKQRQSKLRESWNAANRSTTLDSMMDGMMEVAKTKFNAESVFGSSEDMSAVVVGIPLPSLSMEYLTGNSVWPLSSLTQLAGRWGTCKSSLAYDIFRWFYECGGRSICLDTESKFSPELCRSIMRSGDDSRAFHYNRCKSVEDWQDRLTFYVREWKKLLIGTKEVPGPGKVVPVVFAIDSLAGASSEEVQEKILKEGHASRMHPINALKNSIYLSGIRSEFDYWPFSLVIVNHLKERTDDSGRSSDYTPGGERFNFIETYEIHTSLWSKRIANSQFEGVGVRLTCTKNSLAPTNRRIRTRLLWWSDFDDDGEKTGDYRTWDWNWSTVAMLYDLQTNSRGPEGARLKKLGWNMEFKSPSADIECMASSPLLGMKKGEFLPWPEMGELIHSNPEVMTLLRKALGVEMRRGMSLGEDYEQQVKNEQGKLR
jgi:hypothetical protein